MTTMKELGYVSIPALKQYISMAESCGVDCHGSLKAVGLNPSILDDNSKRISGECLEHLLSLIIPLAGDPLFGLHTSEFIQPSSYSVLGYIAMNCATLGDALLRVPTYEKIVGDLGVTTSVVKGNATEVRWHCNFDQPLVRRHVIENVLASWTRYTRWMTNEENENPIAIHFEHIAPDKADFLQEYEAIFRAPIKFNQPYSAVIISSEHLAQKLRQADTQLLKTLEDHATSILQEIDKDQPLKEKVKNMLRLMLKEELPRKEVIAEKLGLNSRTMQRRLNDEGSGYQELLNELRYELAQNYLRNSRLNIDEIGVRLGFAEPRSFHRSFKQWSGATPGAYRESH